MEELFKKMEHDIEDFYDFLKKVVTDKKITVEELDGLNEMTTELAARKKEEES